MPTVKIPHQFFRDEKTKLYSEWRLAFWRELLQNSIDAGATRIDISVAQDGDNIRCFCEDDGCGMSADLLENVYFRLGESSKGQGSIGGFGRARIMTCFGNKSYRIRTMDNIVDGEGSQYEISSSLEYYDGCSVEIEVDDATQEQMLSAIRQILSQSTLSQRVFINGNEFSNWLKRGRRVRELSFGGVYTNISSRSYSYKIISRVNGLSMFTTYVNLDKQIVVEIDPEKSRDVLNASRSSFINEASREFTRWQSEIAVDSQTSLRARNREVRELIRGAGCRKSSRRRKINNIESAPIQPAPIQPAPILQYKAASTNSIEMIESSLEQKNAAKENAVENDPIGKPFDSNLKDIMFIDESDGSIPKAVVERFHPSNWTREIKKDKGARVPYNRGREYYRLLRAFEIACEEAVCILIEEIDAMPDALHWGVGWAFGPFDALHTESSDGVHFFMLNPIGSSGSKARFKTGRKEDLIAIIALAQHEVAHSLRSFHDEEWGNALTRIAMRYDVGEVIKKIKKTLKDLPF